MRIAVISHWLPEPGLERGDGLEATSARAVHDVAQGLSLRGHAVTVWSFSAKPPHATYEVRPLPGATFVRTSIGRFLLDTVLGNFLVLVPHVGGFDAVFCFDEGMFLPLKHRKVVRVFLESGKELARFAKTPVDRARHWIAYGEQVLTSWVYQWLKAKTVAGSAAVRATLPAVRRLIPIGVDRTVFFAAEADRSKTPLVVFHGSLEGRRRGLELVRGWADAVQSRVPDAELVVLGTLGPGARGVKYVERFADDYALWLRRAWVVALPSRFEPTPQAYLEPMACGTPVVATENPESRELFGRGKYGPLATDEAFADKLVELLSSATQRQRWSGKAIERAQAFDLNLTLDAYEQLLAAP
jgi:glycosyltransferase involved in cell wall biosynthesis